jgi:hypothetical protein
MAVAGKAMGGKGDGVKVDVGDGINVRVSVGISVIVLTGSGVCVADSGWKGVGVGDALGSFVTRLRGGGRGEAGVAEKHAVIKVIDKRQNVRCNFLLYDVIASRRSCSSLAPPVICQANQAGVAARQSPIG